MESEPLLNKAERVYVNLLGAQESNSSLAESIPGLLKRWQILASGIIFCTLYYCVKRELFEMVFLNFYGAQESILPDYMQHVSTVF
jgi:hypothetical protein